MTQCKILEFPHGVSLKEQEQVINNWLAKGWKMKTVLLTAGHWTVVYLEKTV